MAMPHLIYKLFYIVLHLISTLVERFVDIILKFKFKFNTHSHEFFTNNGLTQKLNKIPNHLTVIVGHNEEPSLKDLANIVIWCLAVRISFVSIYDYKGIIKQREEELKYCVEEKKPKEGHIIWSNKNLKNGYVGRKIYVKILNGNDGKGDIVNLTKNIAKNSVNLSNNSNIDSLLKENYQFPNPDMGLCCDTTFCLYNYPPWQIAVTEFFHIKTKKNIKFEQFAKCLMKYSKCEQRFGH